MVRRKDGGYPFSPHCLMQAPGFVTYLGPQREGLPPWEELLWLQQLPGPPGSVGPIGKKETWLRDAHWFQLAHPRRLRLLPHALWGW